MLDARFLALWLRRLWQKRVFAEICDRWIGQSAVQKEKLLDLQICLPHLEEQKRIAAMLYRQIGRAEEIRIHVAKEAGSTAALASSMLHAVFASSEARMWPRKRIDAVAKTASGTTPSRGNPAYFANGTVAWIKTGELKDNLIEQAEELVTEQASQECSLPLLPVGTVLVAMYGQGQTRGRTGLLAIPATTNQACFAILPNPSEFEPRFLQYWFRHNYEVLRSDTENRGGSQPNLNGVLLRSLEVSLPPVHKQREIAGRLDQQFAMAREISKKQQLLASAIEDLPAAFLRRAFSAAV